MLDYLNYLYRFTQERVRRCDLKEKNDLKKKLKKNFLRPFSLARNPQLPLTVRPTVLMHQRLQRASRNVDLFVSKLYPE